MYRFLAGDDDLPTMVTRVTRIAVEAVPGVDFGSITMLRDGTPTTTPSVTTGGTR